MRQRSGMLRIAVGLGLLLAGRAATADVLPFTGNVETDFPSGPGTGVVTIVDNPNASGASDPRDVAQDPSLPGITGWNIKDLRLSYDQATDTMRVGVNFFGIAGDADGNGDPGTDTVGKGMDLPSLGGRESIAVALDTDLDGKPDVIAGVPAIKPQGLAKGTDAFTVAKFQNTGMGLGSSFGKTMTDHLGQLAFDPSAAHPDLEFTITHFKGLPGLVPDKGFIVSAFAGSDQDVIAGEDYISSTRIAFPGTDQQQAVPEPSAVLAWALVAGGTLGWRHRRRSAR